MSVEHVESVLGRLIDKSLVYLDRSGSEPRFRMLQTLSDYASHRLTEHGDDEAARHAHASWVRDLARSVEFGAKTSGASIAAVHDEDVAVRDAVSWALHADPPLALEICSMLAPFWFGTMRVSTGWELLAQVLDAAGDTDRALRTSALEWAVVFSTMHREIETADRFAEEATAFAVDEKTTNGSAASTSPGPSPPVIGVGRGNGLGSRGAVGLRAGRSVGRPRSRRPRRGRGRPSCGQPRSCRRQPRNAVDVFAPSRTTSG